jgi:hypothetical protein
MNYFVEYWELLTAPGKAAVAAVVAFVGAAAVFVANVGKIRSGIIDWIYPEPPKLSLRGCRMLHLRRSKDHSDFIAEFEGTIQKEGRNPAKGCWIEVRFPDRTLTGRLMDGNKVATIELGYGSQSRNFRGTLRVNQLIAQLYITAHKNAKSGKPLAQIWTKGTSSDWVEIDVVGL